MATRYRAVLELNICILFNLSKIIDHPLSSGLKFILKNSKTGRKGKSINRDIKIKFRF